MAGKGKEMDRDDVGPVVPDAETRSSRTGCVDGIDDCGTVERGCSDNDVPHVVGHVEIGKRGR